MPRGIHFGLALLSSAAMTAAQGGATTRRTFLRVIGSAAVGLAALPYTGAAPAESRIAGQILMTAPSGGPITYQMLEAAYQSAVVGPGAPSAMLISQSLARKLGLVMDAEIPV